MNKVVLLGRISSEIELRQTQTGIATCVFSVAINNGKDKDGKERPADFITCRAWRQQAEFISRWFQKGKMIFIEGKFKTDKYQNKQHSDVTMYSSYVLVDNVEFCGDKGSGQAEQTPAQNIVQQAQGAGIETGNLDEYEVISDGAVPF